MKFIIIWLSARTDLIVTCIEIENVIIHCHS